MRQIWKNGKIVPETEAYLSIYDSALMFGDMCFEMTRSFKGIQFKLEEHIKRLFKSCKFLRIPVKYDLDDLRVACHAVQMSNQFEKDDEHRLMINVSRGILPMYGDVEREGTNIIISDFPLRWTVAGMGQLFDVGVNAVIPSQRAIPALEPKVKSRSRIHYFLANTESDGWAVLLDHNGNLSEGPGWNFFAVIDDKCTTPKPGSILKGISRQYVIDNFGAIERDLNVYDVVSEASEAFVTATPFCMLPVVSLNGIPIGDGKIGPVYKELLSAWSEDVGVDIKGQIQIWDGGKGVKHGLSTYGYKRRTDK